jgi:hypothetical protein
MFWHGLIFMIVPSPYVFTSFSVGAFQYQILQLKFLFKILFQIWESVGLYHWIMIIQPQESIKVYPKVVYQKIYFILVIFSALC